VRIASWNVQWCRGLDGVVDPARIAAELRRIADPDIACLQEIASGFADLSGSRGEDQPAALGGELPDYEAVVGWGVDVAGAGRTRKRFGNMILSRLPLGRVRRHSLPWPASPTDPSMPRVAVEAVVDAPFGSLRVVCTHLEYYLAQHRAAQVARLAQLRLEWLAEREHVDERGPFRSQPSAASTLVCGEFHLPPDDPLRRCVGVAASSRAAPAHVQAARARPGRVALLLRFRLRDARPRASPALDPYRRGQPRLGSSTTYT
jgi:endonuclease/exonuclease/phosphatase family metal-dependent hydrolase